MTDYFKIGYLVIVSTGSLFGIPASAFIVVVNLIDWVKARVLNACDCIILSMGISGVLFQCTHAAADYIYMIWNEDHDLDFVFLACYQLVLWSAASSFWFTACLCVYYCVKIVEFSHPLFQWLKLRISKLVSWMLLGSVVGGMVFSVPIYWNYSIDLAPNSTTFHSANCTVRGGELKWNESYMTLVIVCCFCLPLLVGITSITFILTSLYRHTQQMKMNMPEFSQPRLDAHIGAARMVCTLLLIYTFTLLAAVSVLSLPSCWVELIIWTIFSSFATAQAIAVILGNTKLKNVLQKVLSSCK